MKSRLIWAAVVVAALVGFYFATIRPAIQPTPQTIHWKSAKEFKPPEIAPPPLPVPVVAMPEIPPPPLPPIVTPTPIPARRDDRKPMVMEVPIQNRTTIDFSIGAPVIRAQPEDQAALERALKEMADATKDTTFAPSKK